MNPALNAGAVALVTGSNRGLGLALVQALLDQGAAKVYAGVRDLDRVGGLPDTPRVVPLRVDLEDRASIHLAAQQAYDITLLINNAAHAAFGPPLRVSREDIAREITVNYLGTYDVIEAFVPALSRPGLPPGVIINVLSKLALSNEPSAAGYAASKAALHFMSDSLRTALAPRGVRVCAAYPGGIDTDMLARYHGPKTPPGTVARNILFAAANKQEHSYPDPESQEYAAAPY